MDHRSGSQVPPRNTRATPSSPIRTGNLDPRPVHQQRRQTSASEQRRPAQTKGPGHSSTMGQSRDKSFQPRSQISSTELGPQHSPLRTTSSQSNRQGGSQQHVGPSRYTSQGQNFQRNSQGRFISPERQASVAPNHNSSAKKTTSSPNTPLNKLLLKPRKPRSNRPRKNVYVPTTLTVATLAKLLKVKLGGYNRTGLIFGTVIHIFN